MLIKILWSFYKEKKNRLKLTILVDNIADNGFIAEHGFAVYLEVAKKNVLFDCGQGNALFQNAKKLNIALDNIDYFILSHGHYDHGGNIKQLFEMNSDVKIIAHQNCTKNRWSINPQKSLKYIGLSETNKDLLNLIEKDRLTKIRTSKEIIKNFWITGEIPRLNSFENVGGPFYDDTTGTIPDRIEDDMAIWMNLRGKLVILCGCCHSGLVNTIDCIRKISGLNEIKLLIGGFHLKDASEKRLNKTVSYLNKLKIEYIVPAHCTGESVVDIFKNELNADVIVSKVGFKFGEN